MGNRKGRMSIGPSVRALRHELDELLERLEMPRRRSSWLGPRALPPRRAWLALLVEKIARAAGISKRADASASEDVEVLTERPDCYVVRVFLPDVRERDIDVRLEGEVLAISGEQHHESAKREQGCAYTERHYTSFTRSIELPRGVDSHRIEAHYVEGVLEVVLPKRESPRTKQIPIVRHEARMADGNGASPPVRRPTQTSSLA